MIREIVNTAGRVWLEPIPVRCGCCQDREARYTVLVDRGPAHATEVLVKVCSICARHLKQIAASEEAKLTTISDQEPNISSGRPDPMTTLRDAILTAGRKAYGRVLTGVEDVEPQHAIALAAAATALREAKARLFHQPSEVILDACLTELDDRYPPLTRWDESSNPASELEPGQETTEK